MYETINLYADLWRPVLRVNWYELRRAIFLKVKCPHCPEIRGTVRPLKTVGHW